jgi:hypothetical protein
MGLLQQFLYGLVFAAVVQLMRVRPGFPEELDLGF